METKRICPSCRKTLPPNVPLGLCPGCLIKSGFNTGTEPGNPGKATGFVPPPVEEIRKLFPQLEIIELIGKGGMGAVYKARQTTLDRFVALKILPPGAADDAGFAERFNREARALARLNHPHIVAVHDFGQAGSQPYLVMEFVDGPNLRQVEQAGRLTPEQALQIVPQICEALQFAHNEGVVHRDIKPENILLDKKGRVKITDFGIAKILGVPSSKVSLTGAKDFLGTPHYMAPEQVEHPQTVDHRADIFSLGVVFYELLTGELPLGKFQPPSRKVQVDVRLDEIVLHTLEKEPDRRYQHASEVKTDVEMITSGTTQAAPMLVSPEQVTEFSKKSSESTMRLLNKIAWSVGASAVLFSVLAGAVVLGWFQSDKAFSLPACLAAVAAVTVVIISFGAWLVSSVTRSLPRPLAPSPVTAAQTPVNVESVRRQVSAPAIGLVVTGILNWLAIPLFVLVAAAVVSRSDAPNNYVLFVPLAALVLSSVMIVAGLKMRRLEAYGLAITGSILSMLVSPGNLIGLPIGIWALVVLCHREVRAAFGKNHPLPLARSEALQTSRGNGAWKVAAVIVAAVMIVLAIPVGALFVAITLPALSRARQRAQVTGTNTAPVVPVEPSSQGADGSSNAIALTQEGWQLWQGRRPAEAIPKFESAAKLDSKNTAAWNGLGWASFNTGKSQEAKKAFQKVIELEPNHPAALNGLGQVYLAQKKYAEAESYLLKASAKAPAAWYGLARLYLIQGKFDQAEKWAQNLVDSGQADEVARRMLQAARDKKVSDGLRLMLEPQ